MKTTIKTLFTLTLTVLIIFTCEAQQEYEAINETSLRSEIQAMENAFAAGEKAKDADAVAAYYSDDAINYSRNKAPNVGKASIRNDIAEGIAKDTAGLYMVYEIVDLFAEGNTAVEIGSWTEFGPDGKTGKTGHYMSYFEKRDGKYLCVRDMSTSNSKD